MLLLWLSSGSAQRLTTCCSWLRVTNCFNIHSQGAARHVCQQASGYTRVEPKPLISGRKTKPPCTTVPTPTASAHRPRTWKATCMPKDTKKSSTGIMLRRLPARVDHSRSISRGSSEPCLTGEGGVCLLALSSTRGHASAGQSKRSIVPDTPKAIKFRHKKAADALFRPRAGACPGESGQSAQGPPEGYVVHALEQPLAPRPLPVGGDGEVLHPGGQARQHGVLHHLSPLTRLFVDLFVCLVVWLFMCLFGSVS